MSESAECARLRPYLVDFVVGELSPDEDQCRQIEQHLAGCECCRAVAEELRGTGRALEAIGKTNAHLDEQARRELSTKARIEAEKLRAAADRRREAAAASRPRRVPFYAWLALLVGTGVALALAIYLPQFNPLAARRPAARVLHAEGAAFAKGQALEPGAELALPADALLRLELADRSRLDLRGPAQARLAGAEAPLEIRKGLAWLHAGGALRLKLPPLRGFELESGAQAAFELRPAEDEALLAAVLGGGANYSAAGGDGKLAQGQTLAVQLRSGAAAVRPSKEPETAPWHRTLPPVK